MKRVFFFALVIFAFVGVMFEREGAADHFWAGDYQKDASGIALTNDGTAFIFIGDTDEAAGHYYVCPLDQQILNPDGVYILKKCAEETIHGAKTDLMESESLDITAEGRVIVLSEKTAKLISQNGETEASFGADYISHYSNGNRGLEGLAIKQIDNSEKYKVAVLLEGGYPEDGGTVTQPVITTRMMTFDGKETETEKESEPKDGINLKIRTKLEGKNKKGKIVNIAFRGSDLVWTDLGNGPGFIVLLSSVGEEGKEPYNYTCLAEFKMDGTFTNRKVDLRTYLEGLNFLTKDENKNLSKKKIEELNADYVKANWEGMGWFKEGETLVLIHDKNPKGDPRAVLVPVSAFNSDKDDCSKLKP